MDFEHSEGFECGESHGGLALDHYEDAYRELLHEVLEDGIITPEERVRLDRAASSLGLDRMRLNQLEFALRAAYEQHHGIEVLDAAGMFGGIGEGGDAVPESMADSSRPVQLIKQLRDQLTTLQQRVRELESQLDEAQAQLAIEVDLSELEGTLGGAAGGDPALLHRRLRHDPRDAGTLRELLAALDDPDRRFCIVSVLSFLEQANDKERGLFRKQHRKGLIQPSTSLDATAWRRSLQHPDEDPIIGELLGIIASPVLLGHVAALGRAGTLPRLDPDKRVDPAVSTVQAARCFAWAGEIVGTALPALYTAPELEALAQMIPAVPPATQIGRLALSGREPSELAWVAGRQLAYFRHDRFMRLLVPNVLDLEDLFLAGLLMADGTLPLAQSKRARVEPIAAALAPLLEPAQSDALQAAYRRFVASGGRANLGRWSVAADMTAARTGLLLCGDLRVAERMLKLDSSAANEALLDDLLVFASGERYPRLRAELGIGVGEIAVGES